MALTAGSVSVAVDGTVTKSGAAGRLYDKIALRVAAALPGGVIPAGAAGVPVKTGIGQHAQDIAEWLVTEVTTYATAKIASGTGALQKTPDPNNANTDTVGPAADKFLPIV